jgi:hypothetical protein
MARYNLPCSWFAADTLWHDAQRKRARDLVKLAHNTWLDRSFGADGYAYHILYHYTRAVSFMNSSGDVILRNDGWNTPTTRERHRSCGFEVGATLGIPFLYTDTGACLFTDGMYRKAGKWHMADGSAPASKASILKAERKRRREERARKCPKCVGLQEVVDMLRTSKACDRCGKWVDPSPKAVTA